MTASFIDRLAAKHSVDPGTKVVLLLAYHRESLGPDVLAEAVTFLYGPAAVQGINEVVEALNWAVRLSSSDGWEPFADVLKEFTGERHIADAEAMAAQFAEEREADAIRAAQLVASLLVRGVAA